MLAIQCENINKSYQSTSGLMHQHVHVHTVLKNLSFEVEAGETLGILGPSGCGKSTLGRILCGLLPASSGKVMLFQEEMKEFKDFTGKVQMVFQNPFSSLNPRLSVGYSISEPYILQKKVLGYSPQKSEVQGELFKMLEQVGIKKEDAPKYPHEFSGGQRQRIALARALITRPPLLICDEAVSALDVSIQAQILNLLRALKKEYSLTLVFISHNQYITEAMSQKILRL